MKSNRILRSIMGLAVLVSASQALAGPLTLSNVTGSWANDTYLGTGTGTVTNVGGQGTDMIRWGIPVPAAGPQSGYDFTPVAFALPGLVALDTPFLLGTFNHLNFPIKTYSLDTADYLLSFDTDGAPVTLGPLTVSVDHNETPNAPCASPGCDDVVTISSPAPQVSIITSGADTYLFRLVGWSLTNDGNGIGGLVLNTIENQNNVAYLYAEVTRASVPEPGILSLLGLGLLGIGVTSYKRSHLKR